MNAVPVYADPQIYGANGEYFYRIVGGMLEDLPKTANVLMQDAVELEQNVKTMIGPFERLALLTRLAARDHVPYKEGAIEELRLKLADIQKKYIEDSKLDFIDQELRDRLETAAGWLAQAIFILAIDNHPAMAAMLAD